MNRISEAKELNVQEYLIWIPTARYCSPALTDTRQRARSVGRYGQSVYTKRLTQSEASPGSRSTGANSIIV